MLVWWSLFCRLMLIWCYGYSWLCEVIMLVQFWFLIWLHIGKKKLMPAQFWQSWVNIGKVFLYVSLKSDILSFVKEYFVIYETIWIKELNILKMYTGLIKLGLIFILTMNVYEYGNFMLAQNKWLMPFQ